VLRFFPNDVASFEPVVALLTFIDARQRALEQGLRPGQAGAEGGAPLSLPRLEDGQGLWEAQASRAQLYGFVGWRVGWGGVPGWG